MTAAVLSRVYLCSSFLSRYRGACIVSPAIAPQTPCFARSDCFCIVVSERTRHSSVHTFFNAGPTNKGLHAVFTALPVSVFYRITYLLLYQCFTAYVLPFKRNSKRSVTPQAGNCFFVSVLCTFVLPFCIEAVLTECESTTHCAPRYALRTLCIEFHYVSIA